MLPVTFLLLFLSIPEPHYVAWIDRARFPSNDELREMQQLNEAFRCHCQVQMVFCQQPELKDWWADTLHEAEQLDHIMWLLREPAIGREQEEEWKKWMAQVRDEMSLDDYMNARVYAVPYWRCVMVDR